MISNRNRYGRLGLVLLLLCSCGELFGQLTVFPEAYHMAVAWQARGWHKAAVQVFDSLLTRKADVAYLQGAVVGYLALRLSDSAQARLAQYPLKTAEYALVRAEVGCATEHHEEGVRALREYLAAKVKRSEQELQRDTLLRPCQATPAWEALWKENWYTPEQQGLNHLEYLAYKGDWHHLLDELDNSYTRLAKRPEYAYLRALALEGIRDLKSALLTAEVATDARPRDIRYGVLRTRLMLALGYKRQAEVKLLEYQKRDPHNPALLPQLAWTQLEIGRLPVAYATAQRYLEYYPQDTAMLRCAAIAAFRNKQYTQSLNMLARLHPLASSAQEWEVLCLRGDVLAIQGEYRQALVDYQEALTHRPQDTALLRRAGMTYLEIRDSVAGCRLLERAQKVGHAGVDRLLRRYCGR